MNVIVIQTGFFKLCFGLLVCLVKVLDCWAMMYRVKGSDVNMPLGMWWWGVGGGEASYSSMIRSHSFPVPVPLDCELHMCFTWMTTVLQNDYSVLELAISLPLGRRQEPAVLVTSLSPGLLCSDKPQLVRFWLNSFTSQQNLRTEYSGVFQKGSLSPPPAGSTGDYSPIFTARLWYNFLG